MPVPKWALVEKMLCCFSLISAELESFTAELSVFVNWNIFLLFKHIPWHFPALMSSSLQLSCFLSLLIFYLTSQTTKQPSTLGASLRSLCSHRQPSELSSRLQQTAWEQGFGREPHPQSLTLERGAPGTEQFFPASPCA